MKKTVVFSALVAISAILGLTILSGCQSGTVSKESVKPKISTNISKMNRAKIEDFKKVIVFVSSKDANRARLFEDAFAGVLEDNGFSVISRARSERIFQEEVVKAKDKQELGAAKMAKKGDAQAVLAVTIDDATHRFVLEDKRAVKTRVITNASLQIIDVDTEDIIGVTVAEYPSGAGIGTAASDLAEPLGTVDK